MRRVTLFALIALLPAAYLGINDFFKYQNNPSKGFHFSTIGEVWLDHAPTNFNSFKASYKTRTKEWDENIRPYLDWNAFSTALTPGLAINLGLLMLWLLGLGPFKNGTGLSNPIHRSSFSRLSAAERGSKIEYRRK